MQMFLVRPKAGSPPDAGEQIAAYVASLGGILLMPAERGTLIIGMPDGRGKEFLEANHMVGFVGGVQLADGPAADRLRQIFMTNAIRQLRPTTPAIRPTGRQQLPGRR